MTLHHSENFTDTNRMQNYLTIYDKFKIHCATMVTLYLVYEHYLEMNDRNNIKNTTTFTST